MSFSVQFSENTQNFDAEADLVTTKTGTVAHTEVSVSSGPQIYTVDVTGPRTAMDDGRAWGKVTERGNGNARRLVR